MRNETKGLTHPMPTKEELGRRLRTARFERNLTLKDVANRCGMSATHISEVERGKTSPTIGALQRIAAALGENPSYFVRSEPPPLVRLTRRNDRCSYFATDSAGQPMATNVVSPGIPTGYLQIFTKKTAAGEKSWGRTLVAEAVFICLSGMTRIDVAGESHVLREGDSLQTRLDDGYAAENVGEEENEVLLVFASPSRIPV
jgi:DNA-binding XRE family transcriptional regulator